MPTPMNIASFLCEQDSSFAAHWQTYVASLESPSERFLARTQGVHGLLLVKDLHPSRQPTLADTQDCRALLLIAWDNFPFRKAVDLALAQGKKSFSKELVSRYKVTA